MSRHSIELPPDLEAKAAARAAEAGFDTIEQYLESLVRADAADDLGAPDHLRVEDQDELEAMLTSRLDDDRPSIEATPQFWDDLRRRIAERRGKAGSP
jgi:hypothetical protein